jgi:hypothetical protein
MEVSGLYLCRSKHLRESAEAFGWVRAVANSLSIASPGALSRPRTPITVVRVGEESSVPRSHLPPPTRRDVRRGDASLRR